MRSGTSLPAIVIDQKRLGASSRSTVGTVTEVYTYLRMLFSRGGRPFVGWSHRFSFNHPDGMCAACKGLGKRITVDVDKLLDLDRSIEDGAIRHPAYDIGKWYWREIVQSGVVPPRKPLRRFTAAERERLLWADGVPIQKVHEGTTYERPFDGVARKLERLHVDKDEDRIPRSGREAYRRLFTERTCPDCGGVRLNAAARAVELAGGWTVGRLVDCELTELDRVLEDLVKRDDYEPIRDVVATLVARMRGTLRHLIDIGVGYLSLNRGVPTLSGGESQRVKMARQLDCDLVDLIYILDEPTVGLHPRDIDHLIVMLHRLRDHGNSVLIVEHDPAVIRAADWIVDIGPRAGGGGGELVFCGRLDDLLRADTATSRALNDRAAPPSRSRRTFDDAFRIENATSNNLRNLSVRIPTGVLTCVTGVTGVAGSGKSSLVAELIDRLRRRPAGGGRGGEVVVVDQRPVGRSSRFEPGYLRRRVRPHPARVRGRQPGLARALQLQRQGFLPGMQGPGLPGGRAVVPRRRAPRVQGLRRQAVPGRRPEADLARPLHPRRAGDDRRRRPPLLRVGRRSAGTKRRHRARPAVPGRRGRRLSAPRPVAVHPLRRRSAAPQAASVVPAALRRVVAVEEVEALLADARLHADRVADVQRRVGLGVVAACGESRGSGLAGRGRMPYIL